MVISKSDTHAERLYFAFSMVFKRWAGGSESKTEFALILFSGLMIFNLFSECINRAPVLILSNVNYVKKVVFPLEILRLGDVGFVSFSIWWLVSRSGCCFAWSIHRRPSLSILLLPVVLLPLSRINAGSQLVAGVLGGFSPRLGASNECGYDDAAFSFTHFLPARCIT